MKNILHAECFAVVRRATQTLLKRSFPSYQYHQAASAATLLELLATKDYDLVILGDFPVQSELIPTVKKIRQVAPTACTLVFTAAPERL